MQDPVQTIRMLVSQKRYTEAREFILNSGHPKAAEWLQQIERLMAQVQAQPTPPPIPAWSAFPEAQPLPAPQSPDHTEEIYELMKKMYRQKVDTYRTVNAALNSLPIAIVIGALFGSLIPQRQGEPSFMLILGVAWVILMSIGIILDRLPGNSK